MFMILKLNEQRMLSDLEFLNNRSLKENKKSLIYHSDPFDACENSHAIAIVTEWDEFKFYDWNKIYHSVTKPAKLFDGRNLLDNKVLEKIGLKYTQ